MKKELELTDEMLKRNDEIDNAVYQCINVLAEKEIVWSMQIIGEVTDSIKETLNRFNISVRHPGIVTKKDGGQEYDDELTSRKIVDEMTEWCLDKYKEELIEHFGAIVSFSELDDTMKKFKGAIMANNKKKELSK